MDCSRTCENLQAEDVVPSTTVQPSRVLFELIQDLLHLESGWKRLDQDCRSDTSLCNTELASCEAEDVVPESGFEVVFHLWEIEIRSMTSFDEFCGVVEEVDAEVEERARDRDAVDQDARFVKMPSARSSGR